MRMWKICKMARKRLRCGLLFFKIFPEIFRLFVYLPTYFRLIHCNTLRYEKFAYMLPTWFPGFAYILPTYCLHDFRVFLPVFLLFLHNFFIIGVPFWQSPSGTLPSIKLRLAVDQVTSCRQSSYASTALKWDFRCVKPMFSLSQTYVLTSWNLCFDIVKTMLWHHENYVLTSWKFHFYSKNRYFYVGKCMCMQLWEWICKIAPIPSDGTGATPNRTENLVISSPSWSVSFRPPCAGER